MVSFSNNNRRTILLIVLIAIFSLFALYLRLLPMLTMGSTDVLNRVASDDPLYNLRQVEQMLANFPHYAWFDAMTHFPNGDFIYWGPLFTYIVTISCMIAGAATRPEIIGASLLVPPIMATILVPVMYYVGKSCGDWKTGLFTSGFIAVVSGQYFYRSFYGYLDHHIAEVFFATIFCLAYIYALQAVKGKEIRFGDITTLKTPVLVTIPAGVAYLLGLFTMPTMILFAMIIAIFTLVQFIIDHYRGDDHLYLVLINTVIFVVAIIGLLIFGIKSPEQISLAVYSYGHIYAYLSLIAGTLALYGLGLFVRDRNKHLYPLALACVGGLASLMLFIFSPAIFNLLITSFFAFFGQAAEVLTVQEAMGWSVDAAWVTFNYGLILMALGLCILVYKNYQEEHPHQIFILVWSVIILISTWQHIRYEYYLAINIALLAAIFLSFVIDMSWPAVLGFIAGKQGKTQKKEGKEAEGPEARRGKKPKKDRTRQEESMAGTSAIHAGILLLTVALSILFVFTSVQYSYGNAVNSPIAMNPDWRESLEWLGENTPSTGVDYQAVYEKDSYTYPDSAYGIMSWWDYGHMITYIAKRIPNANPFQRGVAGDVGAAAFFMTSSEDAASAMADQLGTRYIITDIEMDMTKFPAMSIWFNTSAGLKPYQSYFAVPDAAQSTYQEYLLNSQDYYLTMVSRLHNFDGSIGEPRTAYYIEYADTSVTGVSIPVITGIEMVNASEGLARADQYALNAQAGYHAVVLNPASAVFYPIETVPALRHYRLVHESQTNVFSSAALDIKYVKVFEYVRGAHIKGEGIIEVPVVTNTGRTFTYRQQSENGEFIVPYPTTGSPYDVRTTGKYRIAGTDLQYDVTEEAVMNGLTLQ